MKHKFACFRPVVVETEEEISVISKGVKRNFSFSDVNRTGSSSSTYRRHDLRRRNSSSRKTLSGSLKSLLFRSSPRVVPKAIGAQEGYYDQMGIEKTKEKEANNSKSQLIFSNSCSSSSSSLTSHVTSLSFSTSSSMNSLELMNNINEISLKRSSSTSICQNNKPNNTKKARDKLALKSSPNQEGFVFYLVLLALVFNLVFGLVYAIMLTSLALYFMGRHRTDQPDQPDNAVKSVAIGKSRKRSIRLTCI